MSGILRKCFRIEVTKATSIGRYVSLDDTGPFSPRKDDLLRGDWS